MSQNKTDSVRKKILMGRQNDLITIEKIKLRTNDAIANETSVPDNVPEPDLKDMSISELSVYSNDLVKRLLLFQMEANGIAQELKKVERILSSKS